MINKLINEIKKKNSAIVVGLDPYLERLPKDILDSNISLYGKTKRAAAKAIYEFNCQVIDAINDLVVAIKPQIAFYEQYGVEGIQCYCDTIQYAKSKNLIVIGDCKRGDIGSTSEAYANAHIGKTRIVNEEVVAFDEDFVTVNPYLGSDGIKPFVEACQENGKGIFVLVKTSNPSSGELQNLVLNDGKKVYMKVIEMIQNLQFEKCKYDFIGAVVGATYPQEAKLIRQLLPNSFFLVPGYGAQGANANMIKACFNQDGLGAVISASRSILYAFKDEVNWIEEIRSATIKMKEDINKMR